MSLPRFISNFSSRYSPILVLLLLSWSGMASSTPGVKVVYPEWFKQSFYDLQEDLQQASDAGKQGLAVFFSEKSCSYCNAMVEKTFREKDIEQALRKHYDVVGLDVFSDMELVDPRGNSHWAKDFAVSEKARFTPTMVFYGRDGMPQLRLIGYQSPAKMRTALAYLEGEHYRRMSLRDYINQQATEPEPASKLVTQDLSRGPDNQLPLLVVFESSDCQKCTQLRNMLQHKVMQPYLQQMQLAYVSSTKQQQVTTPDGKRINGHDWSSQLGLLHSPSMVFFDAQGHEAVKVDFDILIDPEGREVSSDNAQILDNIRARLEFFSSGGYRELPQFQRWRAKSKQPAARIVNGVTLNKELLLQ